MKQLCDSVGFDRNEQGGARAELGDNRFWVRIWKFGGFCISSISCADISRKERFF